MYTIYNFDYVMQLFNMRGYEWLYSGRQRILCTHLMEYIFCLPDKKQTQYFDEEKKKRKRKQFSVLFTNKIKLQQIICALYDWNVHENHFQWISFHTSLLFRIYSFIHRTANNQLKLIPQLDRERVNKTERERASDNEKKTLFETYIHMLI